MDSTSFLLKDVRIFTGTELISNGYVYVVDGIIKTIGSGELEEDVPKDLAIISHPEDTVIPGLIDAHIHALAGNVDSIEQSLRFGVTTVCDMHNDPKDNADLRKLASDVSKRSTYADFKCAGLGAVIAGGWPIPIMKREFAGEPCGDELVDKITSSWPKLKTPKDAEPFVKQQVEENCASYIKLFHELGDTLGMTLPRPPMDVQRAVVAAAHKYGVVTTGHAFSYAGAMDLLHAGVDGLSHVFLDEAPRDDFIQLMLTNNQHCNPTLSLCGSQTGEGQDISDKFFHDPFAQKMLLRRTPTQPVGLASSQRPRSSVNHAYNTTKAMYKAGVTLLVGTDAAGKGIGVPYGLGMHMEMYTLVHQVGMAPMDVLRSATSVIADRFGFLDRGKIEAGRKADLVLVEGNVFTTMSEPVAQCLPIKGVWREGILSSVFRET